MANDDITLVSTTDSPEQVQAALTGKPVAETPAPDAPPPPPAEPTPPAESPADADTPAEPPADETPEQKAAREEQDASEAGRKLNKRRAQIQHDIDELIYARGTARRDVEAEEARLAELKRQRAELEAATTPKTDAKADAKADGLRSEPKLDAVDKDGNAIYPTYEDFLSDHSKWTDERAALTAKQVIEQERKTDRARIERESVDRAVHERLALYHHNLEEFKKTHADFDAVFAETKADLQDALVAVGPDALKVVDGYTIFDAENAPALTYYLLKHPEELKAIVVKPPQQQLIHLVRVEERLRAEGAPPPARPPVAPPETKAPTPIKPVGSGPTATTVPLDEAEFQDFKRIREQQIKARRSA
jgi:hypothetical protein